MTVPTSPQPFAPGPGSASGPPPAQLLGLTAPAKLNLFLHVTGRRDDGYHLLETAFEAIDLADRIDLRQRDDGRITLATPIPGVDPETDLTVRAARLLAKTALLDETVQSSSEMAGQSHPAHGVPTTKPFGVEISVIKRIPMGAGLGGGSSDAATVLLGLNHLWGLGWSRQRLAELGLQLGADVPFFVSGHTAAYATGVGEQLLPLALAPSHYVLLTPAVHVATATVFQDPELTRNSKPLKIDSLSQLRQVYQAIKLGNNDLQSVVVRRFAPVAAALQALQSAARLAGMQAETAVNQARMSGSGSSVFLPVDDGETALKVVHHLQNRFLLDPRSGESVDIRSSQLTGQCWVVRSLRDTWLRSA